MKRLITLSVLLLTLVAGALYAIPPSPLPFGTLTDTKYCIYTLGTGIVCNSTPAGAGDFLADGTVPMTGNLAMGTNSITGIGSLGATGAGKITKGWFIDGEFTNYPTVNGAAVFDQAVKSTSSPSFADLTLSGTDTLGLGSNSGGLNGKIIFHNGADSNYFTIVTGATGAAIGWTLPTAAPGGANYLLNVDADGTMGYTDPATFQAAGAKLAAIQALASSSGYLKNDGSGNFSYDTPAGDGGYTNLTSFVDQTAWRIFYSDGSGDVKELALGADGTYLKSNGASSAPSFATPAGTGDVVGPATHAASLIPQWNATPDSKTLVAGLTLDIDCSSVSASDDSICSAKTTKAQLDLKAPLASPTFTGSVILPSANADPAATAGSLVHDSTVTNFTNGALRYYNGAAIKQLVDMTAATAEACTNGQVVAYNSTSDLWYCADPAASGGMATDSIWAAAGDLVQGTGNDTAAVLTKGAAGTLLRAGATSNAYSTSTFADTYAQGSILHAATANTIAGLAPGAVGSFLMSNGNAAALSYLAAGAANYLLVGAGTTTAPVWTASSANMISLLGSADYATARTNLGLAIGTNVQAYNANLASLAGLTFADVSIVELTGAGASAVVTSGGANRLLGSNSDNTALEFKNSLSIASLDLTSSTSSIPWIISATAPTTEGQGAWNSTTDILYIGDGAASVAQVGIGKTPVYDVDPIPIHWATNGTTAPTAAPTWLTSTNKARYQDFSGSADSDVTFEWTVPYGIDATVAPTFQVEGWITAATTPTSVETAKFVLACRSYSDNDPLSGAMSVTPVTVTYTFATEYARYDRWISGYSGALSITDLAAGELVICNLKRDTTDTYAQPLGVSWIKMKFAKKLQGS